VLIDTDVAHAFDCDGQLTAIGWIEGESRLQHLFRDQVGVPIRRYLLWHRYLTAMSLLADGASVTRAAHAADFADSAHLTRTAIQMNGFTPKRRRRHSRPPSGNARAHYTV
jgi:AraC-like DNA-binding protein